MALVSGDIIDAARDFGSRADQKTTITDKMLLRQLSRIQRELYQKVAAEDEIALAISEAISGATLTNALNGSAVSLAFAPVMIVDATVRFTQYPDYPDEPVHLIPVRQKETLWHLRPSMYLVGQSLYLRRPPLESGDEDEWTDVSTLTVRYVPLPATLTALTGSGSAISLPDLAESTLVYRLAEAMHLMSSVDIPPHLSEMAERAEAELVDMLVSQDSTTTDRVRVL